MARKWILSLLVMMALVLGACSSAGTGENTDGVVGNGNDITVTGIPSSDANANDFNTNGGATNDNLNDNLNGNLNANDNLNGNLNDNLNGNTNDNLNSNTNTNTNGNMNGTDTNTNGNTNDNANSSGGAMTTTTPAAPAGTGLANPDSYDLFVRSLTAQGLTATPDADFTTYTFAGFPAARGRTLDVNGETVYVVEFQDAITAQAVYQAWLSGNLDLGTYFQTSSADANSNGNSANSNGNGADANGNSTGSTNANANNNGNGTNANANNNGNGANANANNNGQNNPNVTGAQTENVWTYGRILVVYMGSDPSTIELLSRMMTPSSSAGTDANANGNGTGGMDTNANGNGMDANANGNGAGGSGGAGTDTTGANLPAGVMTAIQSYAAQQFGATAGSVQVVSVLPVQFQDSCLGTETGTSSTDANANGNGTGTGGTSAENCAQVVTPGWAVTVLVNGQQYVLHVSQDGSVVRQAPEGATTP